jgi:DNA polymerase-4
MDERIIMHVDIDAFFASVEQVLDPDLRGRPVIVGGGVEGRGVVASASYEARPYGIRAGMPIFKARELCPQAVFTGGHFEHYNRFSRQVMDILEGVSPVVEHGSMDEAYLDLAGCERLYGAWGARPLARLPFVQQGPGVYRRLEGRAVAPEFRTLLPEPLRWPAAVALRLRRTVQERTGLQVSVGLGTNRLVAKAATDYAKPAGVCVVAPGAEERFVGTLDLGDIPGVGRATLKKLRSWNVNNVQQARRLPVDLLRDAFGPVAGRNLYRLFRGISSGKVQPQAEQKPRSMSRETTFWTATSSYEFVEGMLFHLCERLGRALREEGMVARRITLRLRYEDFHTVRAGRRTGRGTDGDEEIFGAARRLLSTRWRRSRRLRLIGVGAEDLRETRAHQVLLFDDEAERSRRIDRCLDDLRERFGNEIIRRGPAIVLDERATHHRSPQSG